MNEKEYRLSVNARAPRGRRKRTTSVGAGGSVYVSLGHTQSADSSGSQSGGSGGTSIATSPSVGGSDSGITEPAAKSAWVLTPSPTSVKIRPDSVIPRVSCTVEKLSGSSNKRLNTTDDLTAEGVALWVKIDDGEWRPYVIGTARNIISSALGLLTTQGGLRMVTQGDDIDPLTAEHLITFALRDAVDPDITYSAVNVPVVRDGADGDSVTIVTTEIAYAASQSSTNKPETLTFYPMTASGSIPSAVLRYINASGYHIWTRTTVTYSDGTQTVTYTHGRNGVAGVDGAQGPMVYPAGEWDAATEYTATVKACPVVLHNGQYYVLRAGQTSTGVNPAEDYASNGDSAAWQLMERMNYVFADILMANFAKLSAAVFYGDYMFSQHGVAYNEDGTGRPSADYQKFTIDDDGQPTDDFVPNYLVNLRTGRLWTNLATLREFDAQNGTLGPFAITSGNMEYTDRTGEYEYKTMRMYPDRMEYSKTSGTAADYGTARVKIGRTTHEPAPVVASVNGGPGNTAVAIKATAERATYCRAFEGAGSVSTTGAVQGYGLRVIDAGSGSRTYLDYTSDKVLIKSSRGGEVVLPSLAVIRGQLGISAATPFMVTITIVAHSDCATPAVIKGRDSSVTELDSTAYPKVVFTGNCTLQTSVALSGGSRMEAVLFFDGTDYLAYY